MTGRMTLGEVPGLAKKTTARPGPVSSPLQEPRRDVTLGATLLGALALAFGYLRGRPAKVDVAA